MNKLSWKRLWIRLHVPCPAFSLFRSYHPLVTDTVFNNPSNGPQSESKLKIERQNPKIRWQILFEQDRTKTFVFKNINYLSKRVFANESFLRTRVFEQFITSINQSRIFKSLVLLFGLCFNQCIIQKRQEEKELKVLWSPGLYICCCFCTQVKILFLYTVLSIGGPHNVSGFEINFSIFIILLLLFPLYFNIWCFFY